MEHVASKLRGFIKQQRSQFDLHSMIKGERGWPSKPEDRDVLYFLAQSLRAHLAKELPTDPQNVKAQHKQLAHRAKAMIRDLASISLEMAQLVVAEANEDDQNELPGWLLVEVVRDLPRLVEKR